MRVLYDWVAGVAQPRPQHAARRQLITMPAAAGNHPGHQSATTQARHLTGQGQLPCAHKGPNFVSVTMRPRPCRGAHLRRLHRDHGTRCP